MAGPEYGTTEAAWKGVLVESDRLSDLHMKIQDHLSEDVPTQIRLWQKDAYHKVRFIPLMGGRTIFSLSLFSPLLRDMHE